MNSAEFNEIFIKMQEEWKKYWINDSASQPILIQERFDFSANLRLANTTNDIKDFFTQRKECFPTVCNNWEHLKLSNIEQLVKEFKDAPNSSFWMLFGPGFTYPYYPTKDHGDPVLRLTFQEWMESSTKTKLGLLWFTILIHLGMSAFLIWLLSLPGYQDFYLLIKLLFVGGLWYYLNYPISFVIYFFRKKYVNGFFIDIDQFNRRLMLLARSLAVFFTIIAIFIIIIPANPPCSNLSNCILGVFFLIFVIGAKWFFGKPESFLKGLR